MSKCELCGFDFGNPGNEWMRHENVMECVKQLKLKNQQLHKLLYELLYEIDTDDGWLPDLHISDPWVKRTIEEIGFKTEEGT